MKNMNLFKLFSILIVLGVISAGCNINPTKKAQTQIFAEGGSKVPKASLNMLTRSYDYHEVSQDMMLKRMRNE
jgi:hypothetical protein